MGRHRAAPGGAALARTVAVAVAAMAALPGTLGSKLCPDQPPCSHCHAAQGKCPNTNEGGLCQAACVEGWYATNTWTAKGGIKDGYICNLITGNDYRWNLPTKTQGGNGHGPDCRPLCPAAPPIPHAAACPEATRQQSSPANSQAGGPCTLDCAAGYIRKGSAAFTCQTECTANCGKGGQGVYESTWEASGGDTATCEPLTCPAAPPVEDARPCAAGSYGERCEATCKPGYRPRGDSGDPPYAYTCAATGLWEGGSLACEPIPDWCPSFTGGSPGVVPRPGEQCALAVGSVCAAACAEGWERKSGDELYTCVAGEAGGDAGTWVPTRGAGTELKCRQLCPVSEDGGPIKGSHFLPGCELFAGGQPCTARCDSGYSSSGEPTYTCSKQAKWTGGSLKCGLTGCADETTLENGTECLSGNIGDTCTPSCSPGYSGTGSAEYTCTAQHKWNSTGDDVHCTAVKDWCPRDAIAELNVEITGECDGAVGTVCAVQCADGSERVRGNLEKDQKYSCQANKEWQPVVSKDLLVCERTCDTEAVPSEEHALMRSDCKGTPRRYCLATCKKGYKQQEGGNPEFLCAQTEDGTQGVWEEGSIVCERSCDPGTAPAALDARNKTLRCDSCDAGRFSPAGTGCLDCAQPNENQTLCLRCGAGHGLSDDKTVCEECARTALVEKDGKCVAPKPSPNKIAQDAEDWFMRESPAGKGLTIGIPLVGIVLCCCLFKWLARRQPREPEDTETSVLRASFLGDSQKLPGPQLTSRDVPARWAKSEEVYSPEDWTSNSNPARVSLQRSTSGSESTVARRKRKGMDGEVYVMFSNDHVRELEPPDWQRKATLGQGSYGVVYKATWRGREVAVKVLKLPDRAEDASAAATEAVREQVEEITKDFVTEVEICCDLNHPNLVRLLGYADKPKLIMLQELLRGGSMDHQLYIEKWKPTPEEVLKAALDVALGMEYLHTMFLAEDNKHGQPIIHRDLKTPNLMLATRPTDGEGVQVKVTDFGLSRDKALDANDYTRTVMMTGCGSVLWMAPEILLGATYNEKVDVFSYAMCLVELVDCKLPWSGVATGAEVPHKVTRGQRPLRQLEGTAERPVDERLAALIKDCWKQESESRPDFTTVVFRVEEMMGIPRRDTASCNRGGASSYRTSGGSSGSSSRGSGLRRGASNGLDPVYESVEPGGTRAASPDDVEQR